MPIIDIQRRIREVGRIRLGEKKTSQQSGKQYPSKLERFRLTSTDKDAIVAAAELYGGTPAEWKDAPTQGAQWEVYTEATAIPVLAPPATDQMSFDQIMSQWYEAWSGGGCLHRCDGNYDHVQGEACACDPENRTCKPTTRVKLILREMNGFGTWRLESHGYNAAVELAASVELLAFAAAKGYALPARLRLDPRTQVSDGKTQHFMVPVIDVDVPIERLGLVGSTTAALPAGNYPPYDPTTESGFPGGPPRAIPEGPKPIQPTPGEQAFLDAMPAPDEQIAVQTAGHDTLVDIPPPRAPALPDPKAPFVADSEPIAPPVIHAVPDVDLHDMLRTHARSAAGLEPDALDLLVASMYGTAHTELGAAEIAVVRWTLDCINAGRFTLDIGAGEVVVCAAADDQELQFEQATRNWVAVIDTPPPAEDLTLEQPPAPAPTADPTVAPTDKDTWRLAAKDKSIRVSAILRKAKDLVAGDPPGSYEDLGKLNDADRAQVWAWLQAQ